MYKKHNTDLMLEDNTGTRLKQNFKPVVCSGLERRSKPFMHMSRTILSTKVMDTRFVT